MDVPKTSFSGFIEDDSIDIKRKVQRYLNYWPWFLVAVVVALIAAYSYLRYAPRIYETTAKVKILDESEGLELPTSAFVFKRTNINLENEIEILTSYIILERVVRQLNLTTKFYEEGTIQTSPLYALPFEFKQHIQPDSIVESRPYQIDIEAQGLVITNLKTEQSFSFSEFSTYTKAHRLPFDIYYNPETAEQDLVGKRYIISFSTIKQTALGLKSQIEVEAIGEQSDLLKLTLKGESELLSEAILNTLIEVFDEDGIQDRQLVSKRTLDFIDDRFVFLAEELDSIEISRQDFKQDNNLVDLVADAQMGLEQRTKSDEEVFQLENQLALAELLEEALSSNAQSNLLPANIGINNGGINSLINDYNMAVLERDKLASGAGANNPAVQLASGTIRDLGQNIKRSLASYVNQLKVSLRQLENRNAAFVGQVSRIPEKEKLLRAIERQQKIKESLYLLLLQKREEAAINLAITEPSIKEVENALTGVTPISPKPSIIYAGALLAGLLLPFGILYIIFMLDTKLHSKEDILNLTSNIPVLAEIPDLKKTKDIVFTDPNDRSPLAESFRILSANVDFILPLQKEPTGRVIFCTSTIKGEGKTLVSLNLSLALSSINKKVLLIGADLRNPQIHAHIAEDKHKPGLSNFLHEGDFDWKTSLIKGFDKHPNHDIILSGSIPPNPANLLTNGRFKMLIEEARTLYDYIIVDTAPTILVTDTMLISPLADATIYIARANYTEKRLLEFSKELHEGGKLKNMAYVVNSVGASKSYGYSYNYGYNYGYGQKS
ncbi:polysaccharide biosynthesis tyrosine autokinase [Winogradskyella sp. DF17]|uniref:non-specific protein-tyrosine kinase n=1 Tax=Winogradskyella pelagia TaxID=2819984 RepID=A0ABS3SZ75_9FLAO|nr:polysaccharide biosynthesis tyrosine autokinase [Winogradskyella sp. DF17]MBO3115793.1 polysaccharide biosynthesis tyrosine autokinase [Winogradskyella sp. DF17]